MSSHVISSILQIIVGLGLLNVWLVRPRASTAYRGGEATSLKEEFSVYGLPDWAFYVVGALKVISAILLIVGVWVQGIVQLPAAVVAVLMVGALAMHAKVKDKPSKSLPALSLLVLCVAIFLLQ